MMNAQTEIRNADAAYNQDQLMDLSRTTSGDDVRWQAVLQRDRSSDGKFVFGVLTTGVYCRPSCPSRRPLRKNVRFYATAAEAERDGLRACKRCRPLDPERDRATAKVRELCRFIEQHSDEAPDLAELAARAGLSRFH